MKLANAIEEYILIRDRTQLLPDEIAKKEKNASELINKYGTGNVFSVVQAQEIFDNMERAKVLRDELECNEKRLHELINIIMNYLKAVNYKKIIFTDSKNSYEFLFVNDNFTINGKIVPGVKNVEIDNAG